MNKDEFTKIKERIEHEMRENDLDHPDYSDSFGQGISAGLHQALVIIEKEFVK